MRIETKFCSGILARPTTGRLRSTGKLSMRVSFTTAPGRDAFHSKSCLYKSRLLLPVNVCVFIIVPTFDDHILPRAAQHASLAANHQPAGPEANRRKGISCFRMKMYENGNSATHSAAIRGKRGNEKLVNAVTGSCWRVQQPFSV